MSLQVLAGYSGSVLVLSPLACSYTEALFFQRQYDVTMLRYWWDDCMAWSSCCGHVYFMKLQSLSNIYLWLSFLIFRPSDYVVETCSSLRPWILRGSGSRFVARDLTSISSPSSTTLAFSRFQDTIGNADKHRPRLDKFLLENKSIKQPMWMPRCRMA